MTRAWKRTAVLACMAILGLALVWACGQRGDRSVGNGDVETTGGGPAASAATGLTVSAPFDVGRIMRQVHFAYRADGAEFDGGGDAFHVRVNPRGAFAVTPLSYPRPAVEDPAEPASGAAATFETVDVRRGGADLGGAPYRMDNPDDGSLAMWRNPAAPVIERLIDSADGVEQSWRFEEFPDGAGDLVVRVRVTGQRYVGETETGLHFQDPATGLGLRYGHAAWVDAAGARTEIKAAWAGSEVVLAVPEAVIESSVFPATLDPTIGAEFGIDTSATVSAWSSKQPAVAFGAGNYLVVWADNRTTANGYDIYGAAVNPAGVLLNPAGIAYDTETSDQDYPQVCYNINTGAFMAAWTREAANVRFARINKDGTLAGTNDRGGSSSKNPATGCDSVAHNYNVTLEVWEDSGNIYGHRVQLSNFQDFGGDYTIANPANTQEHPQVGGYNGGSWMVVWDDYRNGTTADIYGATGNTSWSGFTVYSDSGSTNSNQLYPAVAYDGTTNRYLVVWEDDNGSGTPTNADIRGTRLNGTTPDVANFAISTATGNQKHPKVDWNGTNYLVAWDDDRAGASNHDIYAQRVATAATLLGSEIAISTAANDQTLPGVAAAGVASGGTNYLVAWQDYRNGATNNVYGTTVTTGGAVGASEIAITPVVNDVNPAVAYNGTNYLVVWADRVSGGTNYDIYGSRVTTAGTPLDAAGLVIGNDANMEGFPAVASDGSNWEVVWNRSTAGNYDIRGRRVTTTGTMGNTLDIDTDGNNQLFPAVAWGNSTAGFQVVYQDYTSNANWQIYGRRVLNDGTAGNVFSIYTGTGVNSYRPRVGFDGTNSKFLVAWQDDRNAVTTGFDIYGARVTTASTVDVATIAISTAANDQGSAAVAFANSTNGYLVTWQDYRNGNWDIYGARVTTAGAVVTGDASGLAISTAANAQTSPAVAWDGTDYQVAWQDCRSGTNSDIYGTVVNPTTGAVAAVQALSTNASNQEQNPALASQGSQSSLLVYQYFAAGSSNKSVYGRRIDSWAWTASNGATCSVGGDCGSGFCVDGVCCDTACNGGAATDCQACSVAAGAPSDGTCAPLTGTGCNDGNACTQTDTCQAGICVGSNPVLCSASDQCHVDGTCNPVSGACTNPNAPDGTGCDDGNACTQTDTCQSGTCEGANPVVCSASDQCHVAGTCDPGSGQCTNPSAPDGTGCNDGNACTQTDACQAGICIGSNPVLCSASDQCHVAGACNPVSGACTNPNAPDGTGCNDGNACTQTDACQSGTCEGANPVVCSASDQCHVAGACNPVSGACTNPNAPDGTGCNDGNACTQTDACQSGTCEGANPVVCSASDQCHVAGTCDPGSGQCTNPSAPNGTGCNDGNACTQTDTCQSGTCEGANPVVCSASDQCHVAGTCDPGSGQCTNPSAPDGTSCDDGLFCDGTDACVAGTCGHTGDPCAPHGACDETDALCLCYLGWQGDTCDQPLALCGNGVIDPGEECESDADCPPNNACANCQCEPRTAIELVSFTATGQQGVIQLGWVTATEADNAGFNLWRADSEAGTYARITAVLIPSEGDPTNGATYAFTDSTVTAAKTYWYKLEDVDLNGNSTFHGPVNATALRKPVLGCGMISGTDGSLAGLFVLLGAVLVRRRVRRPSSR